MCIAQSFWMEATREGVEYSSDTALDRVYAILFVQYHLSRSMST